MRTRFVPELERRSQYAAPTIGDSYDLNSYITSHPDIGCLLAEAVCHPENVDRTGNYNKYMAQIGYINEPICRCATCPFDQCYSTSKEDAGYISQYRIALFRQALKEQIVIPAQPSLIPE